MKIAIVHPREETIERLKAIAGRVPFYRVIWVARDGRQAIAQEAIDPPDLILTAINLPDLDAIEVIRRFIPRSPRAILAITDNLARDTARIFEAMGYGLRDVVDLSEKSANILEKIVTIDRLLGAPILRPAIALPGSGLASSLIPQNPPVIAIGASTGGPVALATILAAFPARFGAAIVIIQHLNPEFLPGLVAWLDRQTSLPVAIAREGDYLEAGKVLLANAGNHLRLTENSRVTYGKNSSERLYCPSIDVFFASLAESESARGIAVLLTGMGDDGAAGLARLRARGWHTIAQSRATCVVYGMPKAAIALDAATEILDLELIAPTLQQKLFLR